MSSEATNARDHKSYLPWLGLAGILTALPILLRLEGRLWICACGTIRLWSGQICSADNSQHLLDPFSFTHLLHGFLIFWLMASLLSRVPRVWQIVLAIAFEAAWELFENTQFIIDRYRSETAALGYTGDTIVNSFGDVLCCFAGFLIARQLGWRRSVAVFVILELIMIIWIRDSLLLQILMLMMPIDAVRAWQLCP